LGTVVASSARAATASRIPRQWIGAAVVAAASGALTVVMLAQPDTQVGWLLILGIASGIALQRSRFCFASAFRDLVLFGSGRIMKGILVGLAFEAKLVEENHDIHGDEEYADGREVALVDVVADGKEEHEGAPFSGVARSEFILY